jgi:uncharacterized protein YjbJ (UPF0337 family)
MPKSAKRNQTDGFLDRVRGRTLEAWGALTGKRSTKAKGKATGFKGRARGATGRTKKTAR